MISIALLTLIHLIFTAPANYTCYDDPDCLECMPDTLNQGSCGSCHAFTAAYAFAHRLCRKTAKATKLNPSTQHIISCLTTIDCSSGGLVEDDLALAAYIGFVPSSCQSYMSQNGSIPSCSIRMCDDGTVSDQMYFVKKGSTVAYNLTTVPSAQESLIEMIKEELSTKGAVSATICATGLPPTMITEDPVDTLTFDELNHAVTVIGYEYINSELYWIMVNSWGDDVGYFKNGHGGLYKIKHMDGRLGENFIIFDVDV